MITYTGRLRGVMSRCKTEEKKQVAVKTLGYILHFTNGFKTRKKEEEKSENLKWKQTAIPDLRD